MCLIWNCCTWIHIQCLWSVLRQPRRRATTNHAIWQWKLSRSPIETRLVTKTMVPDTYPLMPTAHYGQAIVIDFHLISLVVIDFRRVRRHLGIGVGSACGPLRAPVASCRNRVLPLWYNQTRQGALCSICRLHFARWGIARVCTNGWLESDGLWASGWLQL